MGEASSDAGKDARLVWITAPDRAVATALARGLVDGGLAACVNVLPGIVSVYRWEGAVHEEGEVLLVAKTTRARLSEVHAYLATAHPYELPECVALAPAEVEPRYLAWLQAACAADTGSQEV